MIDSLFGPSSSPSSVSSFHSVPLRDLPTPKPSLSPGDQAIAELNNKVDKIGESVSSLANTVASLARSVHSERESRSLPAQFQESKLADTHPFEPPATSELCAQGAGGGDLAREDETVGSCPSTAGSEPVRS